MHNPFIVLCIALHFLMLPALAACAGTPKANAPAEKTSQPPTQEAFAEPKREADKALMIKAILEQYPLKLHRTGKTDEQIQFCEQFYADLKNASPNVHYVEPVLKTDDPNHKDLAKYKQCEHYKHPEAAYLTYEPFLGLWQAGTHNYKLYRDDFDQNPENGLEEIIYADIGKEKERYEQVGGYLYVDTNRCSKESVMGVHDGYNKVPKQFGGGFIKVISINGLIQYKHEFYGIELKNSNISPNKPSFELTIRGIESNMNFNFTCFLY